jgi:hypothetical protein
VSGRHIMPNEFDSRIIRYLEEHSVCTVATIEGDRPNASALEYVNDGLKLYFISFPNTQKVRNIGIIPAVAITINEAYIDIRGIKGIQYYGTASVIQDDKLKDKVRNLFSEKFPVFQLVHWQKSSSIHYEVVPQRIDFIDYSSKFGRKEVWTP